MNCAEKIIRANISLLESVQEQASLILLNHAEIPMPMWNNNSKLPANRFYFSIISFQFVYMKMKVENTSTSHAFEFWLDSLI